ncbi:MAG: hypothetical protein Q9220_000876 [cf. Caloplaca sp. 1 TL-2023]
MASSLATQLAHIRVQGINPLDLKAQKKAHSKSLLFDEHHAAVQDFDTLFQLCHEGYQDLCRLDSRFLAFAGNLFSEQSKQEDRTLMTQAQNETLDNVLEDFMGLVGSRLLLKPAAIYRVLLISFSDSSVHEQNTTCLVLTFLPFHAHPIFSTVLSILPQHISATLKFLYPYIQSGSPLHRHAIVHTAAHSQGFFSALNAYVLKVCRHDQQHPTLLSFWSSVTSEAVALMLDRSRLGRLEVQKQNEGDVALRVMPILAEGLSIHHCPDLRVGCFMILTVLSSKATLSEDALTATMDLVVSGWKDVTHAGLICLAVLSQRRRAVKLPKKTLKALVAINNLSDDLVLLGRHYDVGKLVLGTILGSLSIIGKAGDAERLGLVHVLLEANLMPSNFTEAVLSSLVDLSQDLKTLAGSAGDLSTQSAVVDLLTTLAETESLGQAVQFALRDSERASPPLGSKLLEDRHTSDDLSGPPHGSASGKHSKSTDFERLFEGIPAQTAFDISFLSHSSSYTFPSLSDAFLAVYQSPEHLNAFLELSVLRKSLMMTEPLYVSFFIRIWCGPFPAPARAAAVASLAKQIGSEQLVADVQILFPYILHALADSSSLLRRAAADLVLTLAPLYRTAEISHGEESKLPVLGKGQIYGQDQGGGDEIWLSSENVNRFIEKCLVPHLEEFRLEHDRMSQIFINNLSTRNRKALTGNGVQKSEASFRSAVLTWLCSHVINTPMHTLKSRLLPVLLSIDKAGGARTTTQLLPLLHTTLGQGQEVVQELVGGQNIDIEQYLGHVMEISTPKDKESVRFLESFVDDPMASAAPLLYVAAFRRLRNMWPLLHAQMQMSLGRKLLEFALQDTPTDASDIRKEEALQALQDVKFSTDGLQSLLRDCPKLASLGPQTLAKRRRIESSPEAPGHIIKKLSLLLEIVESSADVAATNLLGTLSETLADLQDYKKHSGTELDYLELSTLHSLQRILNNPDISHIGTTDIRADRLVDCVRNSSNPHVQQVALLIIARLADVAPELVLHNVMPIFTFMSSNIMRRKDDYSAYVVKQTMDSVIPRVTASLRNQSKKPLAQVSEILLSFTAAFEHIPLERRLPLFQSLINLLGADESLFVLLVLLQNKYPHNQRALQFCVDLLDCYAVQTQLRVRPMIVDTLDQYVATIVDCMSPKPTFSAHLTAHDSPKSSEEFVIGLLDYLVSLLENQRITNKTRQAFASDASQAESLRPILSRIMDQVLSLAQKSSKKTIYEPCQKLLDVLVGGFPLADFIPILEELLAGAEVQTTLNALKSFELRLNDTAPISASGQAASLGILPRLMSIVELSENQPTKRIALACVDRIIERSGKSEVAAVPRLMEILAGSWCLGAANEAMRVTSLLTLSTMVGKLGDEFIAYVPVTLPKTLAFFGDAIDSDNCSMRLHNAAYSFFSALLLFIPWGVDGADLDHLLKVSHGSANVHSDDEFLEERLATLELVAKQIEPTSCCAALERTWANAMEEGPEALKEHLHILESLIGRWSKPAVGRHSETFARLFTKAFDLRRIQFSPRTEDSYNDDEVEMVEEVTNDVAIAMIYKLNDTLFRPIFAEFVDWAASSSVTSRLYRQTTLYGFLLKFFESLKSIVTSYSAVILDDTTNILKETVLTDEASRPLWRRVIQTLQSCFQHDQDGFWQMPAHFKAVSEVLLDQLLNAAQVSSASDVIPAITELAVAADSSAHHKTINATILSYTRSESVAVRMAAVQCQQSLTKRLGEEWLGLLPEMLPFISELQEDDDEKVERETLAWIKMIEDILGESLTPMLQ